MKTITYLAALVLTAQSLVGCKAIDNAYGRAELRGGHTAATADVQGGATIASVADLFARSQTTRNYDIRETTEFGYVDVGKEIAAGIAPVVEGQVFMPDITTKSTIEAHARAGVQVTQEIKQLKLFGIVTGRLGKAARATDIEAIANLSYDLGSASIALEAGTNRTVQFDHNFTYGRLSVPFDLEHGFSIGPFISTEKFGKEKESYNVGLGVAFEH